MNLFLYLITIIMFVQSTIDKGKIAKHYWGAVAPNPLNPPLGLITRDNYLDIIFQGS